MKKSNIIRAMCVSLMAASVVSPIAAIAEPSVTITARVSASCAPSIRSFTIGSGQNATDFDIDGFASGYNCGTGAAITQSGFDIYRGDCPEYPRDGNVYWYRKNGTSSTSSSRISELQLGPGTYCLAFDGGKEGYIRLKYKLN